MAAEAVGGVVERAGAVVVAGRWQAVEISIAERAHAAIGHKVFSFIFLPPWSTKCLLKEPALRMI